MSFAKFFVKSMVCRVKNFRNVKGDVASSYFNFLKFIRYWVLFIQNNYVVLKVQTDNLL